jgi:chromate reductase, NAD(P)H dehydrogenase (quinone)
LRSCSLNRGLLAAAVEVAPPGVEVELFDLSEIPFYNYDVEQQGDPRPVSEFKEAIRRSDALLIATPEYQHGIPGLLKNALDWASRPPGESVLAGKAVAVMCAGDGFTDTARVRTQLRQAIAYSQAWDVFDPDVLVSGTRGKFDVTGRLTDSGARHAIAALLDSLRSLALLLRSAA